MKILQPLLRDRSHGNEHWEFDESSGLMRRRDASINDYRIEASERRIATR